MAATRDTVGAQQGPFERLSTEYRSVLSLVESVTEVLDLPSVVETAETVVDRPADERFRMSPEEIGETYGVGREDERPLLKRLAWVTGSLGRRTLLEKLLGVVERLLTEMREGALEGILNSREQERDALILALYVQKTIDVQDELRRRLARSDDAADLFACWHALISRVVLVGEGEQNRVTDEMLVDLAFADARLAEARGEDSVTPPLERPVDGIREDAVREAAVLAYDRLDITVSRGAELAGVGVEAFEDLLASHGVRPRYGPDDPSELFEGTDAFDST